MTTLDTSNEVRNASPSPGGAFRRFVWPVALALAVLAAFARSLGAAPIWDDEFLTVRNPNLASWSGVGKLVTTDIWSSSALGTASGYYRPLASLSYALNRLVGGNSAASYHAGNVLLHAGVALLLWWFLVRREIARPAPAAAAVALFATLPLVAEPVSWIAGRYDLLGTALALAALLANGGRARAWTTSLAFTAALLSKEPFALVAPLLVLDDVLLLRRRARAEAVKYAALAACALGVFALRHAVHVPQPARLLEQGGALALARAYAFAWETFGRLLVWPVDLCFFHTYAEPGGLACALVLGAVAGAVAAALAVRRRAPAVAFGVLFCVAAMVPGSLTAPTLRIIGDRYAYFPLVGGAVALAAGLAWLESRARARVAVAVVLALAALQLPRLESRLGELQSADRMYRATLARDPDNFTTLTLYADVLARRAEYGAAEAMFEHARRVAPLTGDIDTGLCFVHLRQRRYGEAEVDGRRAVAAKPENPRAWLNLASALVNEKKPAEAVEMATGALRVRPRYAEARVVRALAYLELGRAGDAQADLQAALAIDPTHAQARYLLARIETR